MYKHAANVLIDSGFSLNCLFHSQNKQKNAETT